MRQLVLGALLAAFIVLPKTAQAAWDQDLRLGTAAAPFGWSTVVGDFDADKKPDFAIADRVGYGSNGYEYTIEFRLSQEKSQFFHFQSPHGALNVSVRDLDNDHDLDVVFTQIVSHEIVGIWINDGHGQFHKGEPADFRSSGLDPPNSIASDQSNSAPGAATVPTRRSSCLPEMRIRPLRLLYEVRPIFPSPEPRPYFFLPLNSQSPRAPPLSLIS